MTLQNKKQQRAPLIQAIDMVLEAREIVQKYKQDNFFQPTKKSIELFTYFSMVTRDALCAAEDIEKYMREHIGTNLKEN